MHTPSATLLLDTWEAGRQLPRAEMALQLLGLAWPEASREELAGLPLGERDARLARLRTLLFGARLEARVDCPTCGNLLEFELDSRVIYGAESGRTRHGEVTAAGRRVRFRVPDSGDLLAVSTVPDLDQARDALLARCIEVAATEDGDACAPAELPERVQQLIEQAMEEVDPRANLSLTLSCPVCQHKWQAAFDILGFFCRELEDWAWRLLGEVQCLAGAYGWSERDILAMSPWRRRVYLELAQE